MQCYIQPNKRNVCITFQNAISSVENSVDPDQMASDEAI